MTTQTEALKLALECAERCESIDGMYSWADTITAIKEALAQPEQEPVATLDDLEQEIYENTRQFVSRDFMEWMLKRYYTTPPQRKPLTYVDLRRIASQCGLGANEVSAQAQAKVDNFARAIEAAHGIKE